MVFLQELNLPKDGYFVYEDGSFVDLRVVWAQQGSEDLLKVALLDESSWTELDGRYKLVTQIENKSNKKVAGAIALVS